MKPISKLLCLLILLSASAYANEVRSNSAEQSTAKRIIAQNNNDCKQIHNNQTNEIVMMCRDEEGQYQKVEQNNVDDNIAEPSTPALTENEITDKKTEYIELKQEWQSKLPTASANDLMMIYTRLIELAPDVGDQNMVKQYIRDMAYAFARDGSQPSQECEFFKAVYGGLGEEALNNHTQPNASQADILEIEFPYAKACYNAGQNMNGWKLLNTAFNRVNQGTTLKNPDQINGMVKLASEVIDKLGQINRKEEASTLSESVALVYNKNGYPLKAADWLIKAADMNEKNDKKEFLYKKAVEVIPKNEEYGKMVTLSKLSSFYNKIYQHDKALNLASDIENIAKRSKDATIKSQAYCEAGDVVQNHIRFLKNRTLKENGGAWTPKERLLPKKAIRLHEAASPKSLGKIEKYWAAYCLYSLSFVYDDDYDDKSLIKSNKIFDLRKQSAEMFARLDANDIAKSAFQSSAMYAMLYGHQIYGYKDRDQDKVEHKGTKLACKTYFRGEELGLYSTRNEAEENPKDFLPGVCVLADWWKEKPDDGRKKLTKKEREMLSKQNITTKDGKKINVLKTVDFLDSCLDNWDACYEDMQNHKIK